MSISQEFPTIQPSLFLDFAKSKKLDSRITFTRSSRATRVNENGLIQVVPPNTPRFDHSYNTLSRNIKSLGLLIEEQRTNLLVQSEDFSSASWAKVNVNATANTTVSPDGTLSADTLTRTANGSIYQDVSGQSGTGTYTYSIFLKTGTGTTITLAGWLIGSVSNNFINLVINMNPTTGIITLGNLNNGVSASITPYPNGWYRITATGTGNNSANTVARFEVYFGGNNSFVAWGAQMESTSLFATSYIPTTTTASTRTADNASMTGTNFSSWYNQNEGTIFTTFKTDLNITNNIWSINNFPATTFGTTNNYFRLLTLSNNIHTQYNVGGTNLYPIFSLLSNNSQKVIQSYNISSSPINSALNGVIRTGSGNIYPISPGFNQLEFGKNTDSRSTLAQYTIAQFSYYPKRLTNSQLRNITK
jgi:hypothetical protein